MLQEAFVIHDLDFRESALPNFAWIAKFVAKAMRKSTFDQLHGFLDGHPFFDGQKHMKMVGHYDEIMQFEFVLGDK